MILDNIPAFYFGTSPNKFFDYITLSLPVINNYPGWIAEVITRNNCGIAIEPNNPEAFSEALIMMKCDRESLALMGKNAQKTCNEFDRNKLSDQFVNFLATNINK